MTLPPLDNAPSGKPHDYSLRAIRSASAAKSIRVIGYQGTELPETLTIWDQLNFLFRQLVDLIYCIFSGTICGSNQAQVLEA